LAIALEDLLAEGAATDAVFLTAVYAARIEIGATPG